MGNFVFGYSAALDNKFVDYTASASTENSAYPASNVKIFGHTTKHWRSTVTTESWLRQAFGTAKTLLAIVLYDVNFTSVYVEGSNNGTTWPFSQLVTIPLNPLTQRYQVYIPLTGFNYNYLRYRIPSQTRTDSAAYYRIGSAVSLTTLLTLTINPSYPYKYSACEKILTNTFESGAEEDIVLSGLLWEGSFSYEVLEIAYESELTTLNKIKKSGFLVFYENNGDTSKVYLCRRRSEINIEWKQPQVLSISEITLKEIG